MATAVNTLYPPVLPTFSNAFIYNQDAVIYFTISSYNSSSDVKRVHISVVNQNTNENVLSDSSGIIFSDLKFDSKKNMYYVVIPVAAIQSKQFEINQFYKVQLRFDNFDGDSSFSFFTMSANEKNNYLLNYQGYFSEWSSVCLIKPILEPHLRIKTLDNSSAEKATAFNKGIIPIIGGMYFGDMSILETETLQSYKVQVFSEDKSTVVQDNPTVYTNNTLDPNDINYNIDLQTIDTTENSKFIIRITATTKNQYVLTKDYSIVLNDFLNDVGFAPVFQEEVDNELGIVNIRIKNSSSIVGGIIYIKRLSSVDNFKKAELIHSEKVNGTIDISIKDNTASSLVWYKYSAQYANTAGAITQVFYSRIIMPNFEDAILSSGQQQYNIKYNYNISSMKPVVNRVKIDTLGGKFPKFTENAVLNYKQFSISGTLSAEADAYQKFISKKSVFNTNELEEYYKHYKEHPSKSILADAGKGDKVETTPDDDRIDELVRNDFKNYKKYADFAQHTDKDTSITENNYLTTTYNDYLWEREFRESLLSWLNNGEPKLYRSSTEGAMVVMIADVSLQPTQKRNRITYDFSATMYEIEDGNSLQKLDELNIYPVQKTNLNNINGISAGGDDESLKVVKLGQMYNFVVENKNDIRNLLFSDLQIKYGKSNLNGETGLYDKKNILSRKKPDDLYIKNVKLYFQSKPNLYYFDSDGTPQWVNNNNLDAGIVDPKQVVSGYTFNIANAESQTTIFVNERGYYQIPDSFDVYSLSFNHIGDVVTLEYTLCYNEKNNANTVISGSSIDRVILGQYAGIFAPGKYLSKDIKSKYNFVSSRGHIQYMQYWKGISLEVTPYALCKITYKDNEEKQYLIGETGILHLLKNFEISNIAFEGVRVSIKPLERQMYLGENEVCLDTATNYETVADIQNTMRNTVYKIDGAFRIYFEDGKWYQFKELGIDETNVAPNTSTEKVGLACVPVQGQINYYGSVIQSSYL